MNLQQIGCFIAALRKEQGMTQEQLGEQLSVTNKTVSRWETGTYLPPADALLRMSALFSVSVNELLSGKRLTETEYKAVAEENLVQAVRESSFSLKEKIAYYRSKWLKEHIAAMAVWAGCILALLIYAIASRRPYAFSGSILLLMAAHIWRHNSMMAYVERKAYDGSGMQ